MTQDTICALATPPGGAIAVVRVSGPDAVTITDSIFSKSLTDAQGYTLHFGQIIDSEGKDLDEALEDLSLSSGLLTPTPAKIVRKSIVMVVHI